MRGFSARVKRNVAVVFFVGVFFAYLLAIPLRRSGSTLVSLDGPRQRWNAVVV
jgi:hypothetical protein